MTHIPSGSAPADYAGPKRSLVLSGGGMRLSYQAGAIKALLDNGLCFNHMDGTSGGSLNLSMLLAGLTPEECCERWRSQDPKHFTGFMSFRDYLDAGNLTAVGSADGIVDKVFPHLGIDVEKIREAEGVLGTYNILNYNNKLTDVIEHKDIEQDLIVAGMSLPGLMPPVVKQGTTFLDTGFMQDANPLDAVRRGAEEVWLIWCMGNTTSYHGGALRVYVQMLEMAANGSLNIQFERIAELNERIKQGDSPYGQKKPVVLHVIRPDYPLPLDSALYFDQIDHPTLIDMGYADTYQYLQQLDPSGQVPSANITPMQEGHCGIRFREYFSGKINSNSESQDLALNLNLTVSIADFAKFEQAADLLGRLTGRIDCSILGKEVMAYDGSFNVLQDTDDSELKLINYELKLDVDGKLYYLQASKKIKDDPGIDLLSDATTLFITLYEQDINGSVAGSGVLKQGTNELLKTVKSITVTDAFTTADKIRTLSAFGSLFLGRLWNRFKNNSSID